MSSFANKLNAEGLRRIFDRMDIDGFSFPYYPEMLDFDLEENKQTETKEIEDYHASFGVNV